MESSRSAAILPTPPTAAMIAAHPSSSTTSPKRSVEEISFSENRSPSKRQRLSPDMPAELVDNSTPASQSTAGSEQSRRKQRKKKHSNSVSLADSKMDFAMENGNGAEANSDREEREDEEGGLQEKTGKKKKVRSRNKDHISAVVPADKAETAFLKSEEKGDGLGAAEEGILTHGDAPTLTKAEEAKQSNGDARDGHDAVGNDSLVSNGSVQSESQLGSAPVGINGKHSSRAVEVDSEDDEDKDAIIKRAHAARDTQKETVNTLEASNGMIDINARNDANPPPLMPAGTTDGNGNEGPQTAGEGNEKGPRFKGKIREAKKERRRERRRAERKARREMEEQSKQVQADLPKGGDFSSGEWEGPDDDDNDNMEINLEIDDLESAQEEEENSQSNLAQVDLDELNGGEPGKESGSMETEQTEKSGAAEEITENVALENSTDTASAEMQGLQQGVDELTLILQRKYFTPFQQPMVANVESRPMFANTHLVDFKVNPEEWKNYDENYPVERRCHICSRKGHSENDCPQLTCQHCGARNKHFSHACPDIHDSDDESQNYEWHRIPPHCLQRASTPENLPMFCYICAGSDHYGDECPECSPPSVSGSFSLTEINNGGYVRQDFLLACNDKLELLLARGGRSQARYGEPAGKYSAPTFDPFAEYRDSRQRQSDNQADHRDHRGRDLGSYRPSYRGCSPPPERSQEFDRYRNIHRRSRSPQDRDRLRNRESRERDRDMDRERDRDRDRERYRNRPLYTEYRQDQPQAGAYRGQPPLPNEPVPSRPGGRRGGEPRKSYRPMPSAAKSNWNKFNN